LLRHSGEGLPVRFNPGFWRPCRIAFRCVRLAAWLAVLAALTTIIWCNRVGLPDFLKTRLVGTLAEHGVNLEFSKMRLSFTHGIVAENVRVGEAQTPDSPVFAARQVQLELNYPALLHRRWQLDGLVLRDGRFTLPVSPTDALTLTNLQTDLRFQANDTWSLDHFRADFAGAQIGISGEVAHAPEAARWKLFAGHGANRGQLQASLKIFSDALRRIHFEGEPQIRLALAGDARDPHTISLRLNASADGVNTPWFAARDFLGEADLTAPATAPTNSDAAWGFWTNLQPFRLAWSVQLGGLRSPPLDADAIRCAGVWAAPTLSVTRLTGDLGGGRLAASAALDVPSRELSFTNDSQFDLHAVAKLLTEKTRERLSEISWAQPPALHAEGSLRLPPWANRRDDWRDDIEPSVVLHGEMAFTNAVAGGVKVDTVRTHFSYMDMIWDLPDLAVTQGRTRFRLGGEESEVTKNFRCRLSGQLDEASVGQFLTTSNAVHGLEQLACRQPLDLAAEVSGNLRTLATLSATGRLALTNFAIRGQEMDSVAGSFCYTDLTATVFAPELWRANGAQWMKADTLFLDFRLMAIWITNGWSTADPQAVTRAIGPKTARLMEPYQFSSPPLVRVHGSVPIINIMSGRDAEHADLTFEIMRGVPFRWKKLSATNLTGTVHWQKQELILTNIVARIYDGEGEGWGDLDFRPVSHDCDYDFSFAVTNVNLHLLAADFSTRTNRLEGSLSGAVTVTNASSDNWRSWNGGGHVRLRDGVLWDVPIFAFMSPVLNAVSPGLGNSQAKDAAARFVITNGVIATDSLLIRSMMMRLQYSGTVDLKQNVNARVTAQLLRNTPVFGPLVSTVLWPVSKIFECQVTGRLDDPVVTTLYIPNFVQKILVVPLHPFRSLEDFFTAPFSPPATNAPAAK
jgi:hypothetical protein